VNFSTISIEGFGLPNILYFEINRRNSALSKWTHKLEVIGNNPSTNGFLRQDVRLSGGIYAVLGTNCQPCSQCSVDDYDYEARNLNNKTALIAGFLLFFGGIMLPLQGLVES
jgi:hypothetical protein